jgi:hypothetical protein
VVMDRWLTVSGIWAVPVVVGVVLAGTLGLFVSDAIARGPAWSLPRQNYDELTGHTCGMADDIGVADPTASAPLEPDPVLADTADSTTLPDATRGSRLDGTAEGTPQPPPGVDLGTRWGSRIAGGQDTGMFFSPWFVTRPGDTTRRIDRPGLALFTAGRPSSSGNRLFVQSGRRDGQAVHPLGIERVTGPDSGTWQASALEPPRGTSRIRIIAVDADPSPDGWLAFSAPRRVRYQPLGAILGQPRVTTLMGPEFRLYFPCATNPPIIGGVTRPPDYDFVAPAGPEGLGPLSPMAGTFDLYRLQPLLIRTSGILAIHHFFTIERIVKQPGPGTLTPLDSS